MSRSHCRDYGKEAIVRVRLAARDDLQPHASTCLILQTSNKQINQLVQGCTYRLVQLQSTRQSSGQPYPLVQRNLGLHPKYFWAPNTNWSTLNPSPGAIARALRARVPLLADLGLAIPDSIHPTTGGLTYEGDARNHARSLNRVLLAGLVLVSN